MPRSSSAGLPYLLLRPDTGKYAYSRKLPADIAAAMSGTIRLSWARSDHRLSGGPHLKIALKTGDTATARERWGQVHAQVEENLKLGIATAKRQQSGSANSQFKRVTTLKPEEVTAIVGQARHDVFADDDAGWIDPEHLSRRAMGLKAALQCRRDGTLTDPFMLECLKDFPMEMDERAIRAAARDIYARALRASLEDGYLGHFGQDRYRGVCDLGPDGKYRFAGVEERPSELTKLLRENGIELAPTGADTERRKIGLAMIRSKLGALDALSQRAAGVPVETPPRPAPILTPQPVPLPDLRELHDIWIKHKRPGLKAIDDNKLYIERFIAINGNLPVKDIAREHVRRYRNILEQFPRNVPADLVKRPPEDIIGWAKAKDARLLSRRTVNAKGLGSISTLMEVALREGFIEVNVCQKMRLPEKAQDRSDRLPFDAADLRRLFSSPVFGDPPRIPKAGGEEAAFWLPLCALHSGAREEELAQLLTTDVKRVDGILCFDITTIEDEHEEAGKERGKQDRNGGRNSADKTLKTEASHRRIPVHPALIEIGFLNMVERRKKERARRLFPRLRPYQGRFAKNWSRWWARYQDKYVSDMPQKCFHSFRHTFIDAMRAARITSDTQKALVGHAAESVTDDYGLGPPLSLLAEEIAKVAYPEVDIRALQKVARRCFEPTNL